mgnify:CR=1 FL=1
MWPDVQMRSIPSAPERIVWVKQVFASDHPDGAAMKIKADAESFPDLGVSAVNGVEDDVAAVLGAYEIIIRVVVAAVVEDMYRFAVNSEVFGEGREFVFGFGCGFGRRRCPAIAGRGLKHKSGQN